MPTYPIGVTRSMGTWNFQRNHVERMMDNATYDAAHPDDTLLLAGPARRAVARSERTSLRTLRALGLFQTFSMQSQAPIQATMAIGSGRSFFLRGKSQSSWSVQRVMINGMNILRALYHNAVEAGLDVSAFDDPAAPENTPKSQFFINLDSELFYIPLGLGVLMRTKSHTLVGGCYLELCLTGSWGVQIGAGQSMMVESVSGFCDRILPFQASDAMETPRVGRVLMDAVLGLAPDPSLPAIYNRIGSIEATGLDNGSVPAL
jgi:hypothetical protein